MRRSWGLSCLAALLWASGGGGMVIVPPPPAPQGEAPRGTSLKPAADTVEVHLQAHGMANRLRSLAAAYVTADLMDTPLLVTWAPERSCNASWDDLFEAPPAAGKWRVQASRHLSESERDAYGWLDAKPPDSMYAVHTATQGHAAGSSAVYAGVHSAAFGLVWSLELRSIAHGAARAGTPFHIVITTDSTNIPSELECADFFAAKSRFYRTLAPVAPVAAAVDLAYTFLAYAEQQQRLAFPAHYNASQAGGVVGIHLRMHDPSHDYPVVPSRETGDHVVFGDPRVYSRGSIAHMITSIRAARPGALVFVATNDCSGGEVAGLRALLQGAGDPRLSAGVLTLGDALAHYEPVIKAWKAGKLPPVGEAASGSSASDRLAGLPPSVVALGSGGGAKSGKRSSRVPTSYTPDGGVGDIQRLRTRYPSLTADDLLAMVATATSGCAAPVHQAAGTAAETSRHAWTHRVALADWYVLTEADLIVGSYASSYSEEAAVVHDTPYVAVADGQFVVMAPNRAAPPTCGYFSYAHALSALGPDAYGQRHLARARERYGGRGPWEDNEDEEGEEEEAGSPKRFDAFAYRQLLKPPVKKAVESKQGEVYQVAMSPCSGDRAEALRAAWGLHVYGLYCPKVLDPTK